MRFLVLSLIMLLVFIIPPAYSQCGIADHCGDGICGSSVETENCDTCPQDCGSCCVANQGQGCGSCGGTIKCDGTCSIATPSNYGQPCNCDSLGRCGGTIQCDGSCSDIVPCVPDYGQPCGNCGTIDCTGNCANQGVCSPGQGSCSGDTTQICGSNCQWQTGQNCNSQDGLYCNGAVKEYRDYGCSAGSCTYSVTSSENCNSLDGWYGGGNTQTATCGSVDNDASSEFRDYGCSAGSCTYGATQTQDCDGSDGWYGGGNSAGCGSDPNSVWKDYYVTPNTGDCTSTATCSGTGSVNCDSSDICSNTCAGTVFTSASSWQDYYVASNSNSCTLNNAGGLVSAYSFDKSSGTVASDSSGNGNDGTLVNGPTWVAGKYGNALSFDGVDDVVRDTATNGMTGLKTITLSAWIYIKGWGEGNLGSIVKQDSGSGPVYWSMGVDNDGVGNDRTLSFFADWDPNDGRWKGPTDALSLNTWHHVAVTYDGSSAANNPQMFIDGISVAVTAQAAPGTNRGPTQSNVYVGNGAAGTRTFDGLIDNVHIYNRALTSAEIQSDMATNSEVTEDCATKTSTDTDGSATAYTVSGAVTDYSTCTLSGCTGTAYSDSCSGTGLTEYGTSGSSFTSSTYECQNFESNYCSGDRYYRNEWACTGSPGVCTDAADTQIGTNADGDTKDLQCGDSLCDNAAGVYDSTKTATETACNDGLDNDCDGKVDCADSDCSPDLYQNCCLSATDQTSGYSWTWSPSNHEDAGKDYSTNSDVYTSLFNSDGGQCSAASGGACYDSNNNPVNHKSALTTGSCCGNNANEFYKPDYYGGECTNDVNDCVWSTGDNAQGSDTGNAKWWCYLHEWSNCIDSSIGTKVGGVTCAGTVGSNAWTPNPLPENQYSCTDGLDNDGDGLTDCADSDCTGSIAGNVKNRDGRPISSADVSAKKDLTTVESSTTSSQGNYDIASINCGTYSLVASHPNYAPQTKSNVVVNAQQQTIVNFEGSSSMVLGSSCEADCTFAADNIIHASCDTRNGCTFYDSISKSACDNSQPGWIRDYNSSHYVTCAPGSPQPKIEIEATVSCASGTLVKVTSIVMYNGKPVKLVVAACG